MDSSRARWYGTYHGFVCRYFLSCDLLTLIFYPFAGKGLRESTTRFALTPEEAGLVIAKLPDNEVELSRRSGEFSTTGTFLSVADQVPAKVLRISPVEGGGVCFRIDGGQSSPTDVDPLQVVAQRGEFVVLREIMLSSIPQLVGWSRMLEIAIQNRIDESRSNTDSGGYN
jgi:hypothetical protein